MPFAAQKLCFLNVSYYFTDIPRIINNDNININDILYNESVFNINDQLFLETLLMTIRGNTIKY